jgi:hypothetical protein
MKKRCLLSALLPCQERMGNRQRTREVFGSAFFAWHFLRKDAKDRKEAQRKKKGGGIPNQDSREERFSNLL